MAVKLNFKIDIGSTWSKVLTWKDDKGQRRSLAGYEAKLQIKDRYNGNIIVELTSEDGSIRLEQDRDEENSTIGVIVIELLDTVSATILNKTGVYDLKLYPPGAGSFRLIEGTVTFRPGVTDVE